MKKCGMCGVEKPPEAFNKRSAAWDGLQNRCRECSRMAFKEWLPNSHRADPDWHRQHYAENRDVLLARARAYREANRELTRERAMRRYWNNPEKHRKQTRDYLKKHPEKAVLAEARRRARKRQAAGSSTQEDVLAIVEIQRGCCRYCRLPLPEKRHIDHIVPLSKGGSNWPWNLAVTCPSCNHRKHARTPEQWLGRDDY